MDLEEFKNKNIREELGIADDEYGKICSLIDFGNVDYWFENDRRNADDEVIEENEKIAIDLKGLAEFSASFSAQTKIYYGLDDKNGKSFGFMLKLKEFFGGHGVITKRIQRIRHYLNDEESKINTRKIKRDQDGHFIEIPKCNFDVEVSVDAIRLADKYDTLCLFSGDSDFVKLLAYLKTQKKKKIILIKSGNVVHELAEIADLMINAQDIKKYIVQIKAKI